MSLGDKNIDVGQAMVSCDGSSDVNLALAADDHSDQIGDLLYSTESLDRKSPELWPEQFPGMTEFATNMAPMVDNRPDTSSGNKTLEKEDMGMLQEFGSLTTTQLMEKVRGLQNLAYQLGLDEAREMTRGKFLNILNRPDGTERKYR